MLNDKRSECVNEVEQNAVVERCDMSESTVTTPVKGKAHLKKKGKSLPLSYCVCGLGDGYMIGCEGDNCVGNNWYHPECLQVFYKISEKRSKRLRGDWLCPSCEEKSKKKNENRHKRPRQSSFPHTTYHESEYVLSSAEKDHVKKGGGLVNNLPPLRIESAERQSREEMDLLYSKARILKFHDDGRVQNPPNSGADFPHGLCLLHLSESIFKGIKSLHEVVVQSLKSELRLTPWAGVGESDARKRGYAFLPSRFGKFGKNTLLKAGIRFCAAEKRGTDAKRDETANWNSCIRLNSSQITLEHETSLKAVVEAVAKLVPSKYKPCISLNQLQAIQPNLHNGRDHLPLHIGA